MKSDNSTIYLVELIVEKPYLDITVDAMDNLWKKSLIKGIVSKKISVLMWYFYLFMSCYLSNVFLKSNYSKFGGTWCMTLQFILLLWQTFIVIVNDNDKNTFLRLVGNMVTNRNSFMAVKIVKTMQHQECICHWMYPT